MDEKLGHPVISGLGRLIHIAIPSVESFAIDTEDDDRSVHAVTPVFPTHPEGELLCASYHKQHRLPELRRLEVRGLVVHLHDKKTPAVGAAALARAPIAADVSVKCHGA